MQGPDRHLVSFTADDAQTTLRRLYPMPHYDQHSPSALPLNLDTHEWSAYTNGQWILT